MNIFLKTDKQDLLEMERSQKDGITMIKDGITMIKIKKNNKKVRLKPKIKM